MTVSMVKQYAPRTIWLGGWSSYEGMGIAQRLFGELVRLTTPIQVEYQSDLYWDAMWVRENVAGPMTFWFFVRPYGTCITKYPEHIEMYSRENTVAYRLDVTCSGVRDGVPNGSWNLDVTTLKDERIGLGV